jgi:tRNA (guanine26-N2/guanine27-N2)-dimethyltransferase
VIGLAEVLEGRTKLRVPASSLTKLEPDKFPVFYSPYARINRDISVAITAVVGGNTFLDVLAGVGARGVRIANESSNKIEVTINDFNTGALELAKINAGANGVAARCKFSGDEAKKYLYSRFGRESKYDFVDVDPFGTPASFLQAGFVACKDGGVVSVTATDTAVLCGVYPKVAFRRYGSIPLRNRFKHETAIRILASAARRAAAVNNIGVEPVMAHVTRHYVRVFLRMKVGATNADGASKNEGYVASCRSCGENLSGKKLTDQCSNCSGHLDLAGPLWTGALVDDQVVKSAAEFCVVRGFKESAEIFSSMVGLSNFPPYSVSLQQVCSELRISSVSEKSVIQELTSLGYKCLRQPFEKEGIKTDAPVKVVKEAVRAISRIPAQSYSR